MQTANMSEDAPEAAEIALASTVVTTQLPMHPSYNFEDGDVIVQSTDGLCFKLHKVILRLSSKFFRTMLDILQGSSVHDATPIELGEHSTIICVALDIIYPDRVLASIPSFKLVHDVLEMAMKYEMEKVRNMVWVFVKGGSYRPLEKLALACKYGSEQEIRAAVIETLEVNLHDHSSAMTLDMLSEKDQLGLFHLHASRRHILLHALDFTQDTSERTMHIRLPYDVKECHREQCILHFSPPAWLAFKYIVSCEMEICSSGATIIRDDFWNTSQFEDLWTCCCTECGEPLLDKDVVFHEIKRIITLLPNSI